MASFESLSLAYERTLEGLLVLTLLSCWQAELKNLCDKNDEVAGADQRVVEHAELSGGFLDTTGLLSLGDLLFLDLGLKFLVLVSDLVELAFQSDQGSLKLLLLHYGNLFFRLKFLLGACFFQFLCGFHLVSLKFLLQL